MSWLICPDEKNGLIDMYPGTAAAYSLRNLNGRSGLLSPVVRVRRSSDNTEQDFTATQITDGTLTTFCGAGDGFVRTWYDQSGNSYHLEQSSSASQPQIVTGGSLILVNTKPGISFDNNWLAASSAFPTQSNISIFYVASAAGDNNRVLDTRGTGLAGTVTGWHTKYSSSVDLFVLDDGLGTFIQVDNVIRTGQNLVSDFFVQNSLRSYTNGNLKKSNNGSIGSYDSGNALYMATNVNGQNTQFFIGQIQEAVIYTNDQFTNRTAIEANINAHYSIF